MTATRPSPRRILTAPEPQRAAQALTPGDAGAPLGPFAYAFASIYITIAMVIAAPAISIEPYVATVTLVFPIGALLLAPRSQVRRVVLDGPLLVLVAWISLSVLWSYFREFGVFSIRRDVPVWISASLMSTLLPKEEVIKALKRGVTFAIGATVYALVTLPETRATESDGIYVADVPGWHGYFVHKNVLAPYLIFALLLLVNFESDRVRRSLGLALVVVLLVGSDSITGISGALFVATLYVWWRFFFRNKGRHSSAYVVASLAVGLVGLMAAAASLSALTNAAGKDLTFSGRTFIWSAVLNAIEDRPFLGYGVGGVFWDQSSDVTRSIWRDIGFHVPHSHSGALDVWLNYGLVGLGLFMVLFITSVSKGIRLLNGSPRIAEWFLTLLAVQLLMGLSENVFVGAWLVYMGIARGIVQRELNDLARSGHTAPAEPEPVALRGPTAATPLITPD